MSEDLKKELNEAKQELKLFENIHKRLALKAEHLQKMKQELEQKIKDDTKQSKETQQEEVMLTYIKSRLKDIQTTAPKSEKTEILNLFSGLKQVSFAWLLDLTKKNKEKLESLISELESEGKILNIGERKEPKCNECGSVLLDSRFSCPKCKNLDFESDDIIEHYDCDNVSRRASYVDDVCPQCKKPLKALGVDYKVDSNFYFCTKCDEKFSQPSLLLACKTCNNTQSIENALWNSSSVYKIVL